eukprot:Nitzschia sp. Nitz4//scaffold20_size174350//145527//148397//NITZ4_002126-RA/size174350-processed-gene-0.71-mRNA-1//1//CDS//3329541881//1908//frame0
MADSLLSPTSAPPSGALLETMDDKLSHLLLSNSQFSVASYLNLALSGGGESLQAPPLSADAASNSFQSRMAELALQLQIQTQSCHEDIGRIGAELQAILPRCAADVGRVGVGLEGMRMDAQALLEQTAVGEEQQELSSSLETLGTLHALQANFTKTKEVLTAAATWDSTMSSIPPLLAQQNLTEAVQALTQLESGERALRGMPHREERQAAIAKIRSQVQVLLQPQLQHALQSMNTRLAPLQQCVTLYAKLDKMDSLREEYVKTRPAAVHKAWFAFAPSYPRSTSADSESAAAESTASTESSDFVAWLPTWYDLVLTLATEERRQSATVFGAATSPAIVVRVLRECFRPILPSFQSRLEALFSSSPTQSTRQGSFESICSVYESTLRFLSLAYEVVAGAYLDLAEAGMLAKGDTGVGLYQDLVTLFEQVASPFGNYMQRFDQLESKHLQVATSLISKDMHQVVNSVSSPTTALETLQEAIERLKDLAPYVFPLVEGSLDRFELLNGGYQVGFALTAVGTIVSHHVGEVAIAIRSLSTSMTSNISQLADAFDEQLVLCAMDVMKLAGNFQRDLRQLEAKTRERLSVLADRVEKYIQQHNEVLAAASKQAGPSASVFSLPDSMTIVEIDSILTNNTCGGEEASESEEVPPSLDMLNRLASTEGPDIVSLYPDVEEALGRLAGSCHTFVFDICSAVPQKHLSGLAEMSSWKDVASDSLDSYGTLPQTYITQVGEHMLALVQALEPFAGDQETLAIANEVMDNVKDVALQSWGEFAQSAGIVASVDVITILMNGTQIGDLVLNNMALTEEDAELEEGASEAEQASAAFCNSWLDLVGSAVTARLLERVMRISQLTQKGCEHLNADLNYLVNVFSALGVAGHPHPLITHVAELARLSDDELRSHILGRDRSDVVQGALRAVEARVAVLRGVSVFE